MPELKVETMIHQIATLPFGDLVHLRQMIDVRLKSEPALETAPVHDAVFVAPISEPDPEPNRRWLKEHQHEYAGEWIALDGDRLIAHGLDAAAVYAAADADGAYLPLVTYLLPADTPPFAGV
ncbi:MAG: hypothetical protein HOP19_26070 [Acidobacteria bacterium]|nr:hypothetical protein [Acidobacteriota bacterium]